MEVSVKIVSRTGCEPIRFSVININCGQGFSMPMYQVILSFRVNSFIVVFFVTFV